MLPVIDSPTLISHLSNQTPMPRSVNMVANSLAVALSLTLWLMNILTVNILPARLSFHG